MKNANKKIIWVLSLCLVLLIVAVGSNVSQSKIQEKVEIEGNYYALLVDGEQASNLPSAGVYLIDYTCDNNSKIEWDRDAGKLSISKNTSVAESCSLIFKTNPLVSELPQGSYVAYEGNNGCKKNGVATAAVTTSGQGTNENANSCLGYNANADSDGTKDSEYGMYGYCNSSEYKYHVSGWRIAYTKDDRVYIISAGSPECTAERNSANNNTDYETDTYIDAKKYCNSNLVDDCTSDEDVHAINDIDFNLMTAQATGTKGGYIYTSISGGKYCVNYSREVCGYNNDLIDNGGEYWIVLPLVSNTSGYIWYDHTTSVRYFSTTDLSGLRPVIRLSSSVYITGGSGTMDDPYTIDNKSFNINYYDAIYTTNSTVNLKLAALGVSQMCISNTENCTNYESFSSNKEWTLTSGDGEKTVYVYYKDSSGNIVANLSKSIILDTIPPTNNSIEISEEDGLARTLTISSTGADYMCFSNTSSNVSDCTTWVDYATSYVWGLTPNIGEKTVYAFFKDEAGNTVGPYTASTICTNDCEYNYFVDAYSNSSFNSNIYLMRNDGATALATTSSSEINWYGVGSQKMKVCGADNGLFWCIGTDNNAYYKSSYKATTWNKVSISSYMDVSTDYTYSIYPFSISSAYIVRSDGMTNRISTSTLASTSWTYGASKEMAVCSGYSSSRVICLGKDGYYYYKTSYSSTDAYTNNGIINLTDRTNQNSWIDMLHDSYANIIESDGTNLYNTTFSYSATSASWTTSTIPGGGVKTCATGGINNSNQYNYCLSENGYLYYKLYSSDTWIQTSLKYE